MDLTFGFSSDCALLAILMVIDEHNHGLPIAQMLFTAKQHTKKQGVHGDYDKKLLDMLLEKFVDAMGKGKDGEVFWSVVGCTDDDARERYALDWQMEGIYLLLCLFHIWQVWRTSLNSSLQSIPKGVSWKEVRS